MENMTVEELIKELSKHPKDAKVLVRTFPCGRFRFTFEARSVEYKSSSNQVVIRSNP